MPAASLPRKERCACRAWPQAWRDAAGGSRRRWPARLRVGVCYCGQASCRRERHCGETLLWHQGCVLSHSALVQDAPPLRRRGLHFAEAGPPARSFTPPQERVVVFRGDIRCCDSALSARESWRATGGVAAAVCRLSCCCVSPPRCWAARTARCPRVASPRRRP